MSSNSSSSSSAGKPADVVSLKHRLTRLNTAQRAVLKEKLQAMRDTLRMIRDSRYKELVACILAIKTPSAHPMSSTASTPSITPAQAETTANKSIQTGMYDMGDDAASGISGASGSTAAGGRDPNSFINAILRINPMIVLVEKLMSGTEIGYPDVQCIYKKRGPTARYFKSLLKRPGNQGFREGLEAIVRFISKAKTGKDYTFDLSTVKPAAPRVAR